MQLSKESPLASRLWAWMLERFQPATWLLFFILYATAVLFGRFLGTEGSLALGNRDLFGLAAAWCFFLMLRVFDEHKDYEIDLVNHPQRVLQSGLITLKHLKVLGVLAIVVQVSGSLVQDSGLGTATLSWFFVMAWSALMAVEFFCGKWLGKHLVLYAFSHMLVMPAVLFWLAQMGYGQRWLPCTIGWLMASAFCGGAAFEVTRKTRGPEEERETVDSYSKVWGPRGAALVIWLFLLAGAFTQIALLRLVLQTPSWMWYAAVTASVALPTATLGMFAAKPTASGRKKNEAASSLAMLAGYVVVLAALIAQRGVLWQ
ncbi:MAG: prenyltransferase [Myxococcota bacterium]|jgi:4-hydroxybenzoate polyprenyltransferase|nr:prenyltransferase [Myxococcota bacterium]